MGRTILVQIFSFIAFLAFQVFFVRNLVIYDYAFCYIYVAFILMLPFEASAAFVLFAGFATGVIVDVFYDTLGMHAAAATMLAYFRPFVIQLITPRSDLEEGIQLSLKSMGFQWFLSYTLMLVFVHHVLLFCIEAATITLLPLALLKAVCSTVFTTIMLLALQNLRR